MNQTLVMLLNSRASGGVSIHRTQKSRFMYFSFRLRLAAYLGNVMLARKGPSPTRHSMTPCHKNRVRRLSSAL